MKLSKLVLLSVFASLAFAQQARQDEDSTRWSPVTLAGEFMEHDFINWFGYLDGVYDTYAPISTNGRINNNGSFGWEAGGGVTATRELHDGAFSLSYRGGFRDYQSSFYTTGTDQSLGISYSKRLSRRWSLGASVGGGISFYGGTFFSATPTAVTVVPNNPFSNETKYLSTGLSMTYQQSRRLSYSIGGSYFLQRYSYPGAIGAEGVSGSGSANYRVTARTTVGVSYSHSYFNYQRGVGTSTGDSFQGTASHVFPNHWTAAVAAGVTRSNSNGTSILPASLLFPNSNIGPGIYLIQHYSLTTSFPSFSGTVGRAYHHSNLFASVGQGLSAGNGYYLASKTLYFSGVYSIAINRRQNVSVSGSYNRLSSVSNTVANLYSSSSITAGWGANLVRHFGVNARYDFIHYGSLSPNPSVNDNRLSFGVTFSSKSIPLTIF